MDRNLRAYADYNNILNDRVIIFTKPMNETKRKRTNAYLGADIKWLSIEELKEGVPAPVRNASSASRNLGEATKDTIFTKRATGHGDWLSAYNVELDSDKSYYYVDSQDDMAINPNLIGDDIVVLLRNKTNMKKMERLGVLPYEEVQQQFANRHIDEVDRYIIQSRLDVRTFDHNRVGFATFGENSFIGRLKDWKASYMKEADEVIEEIQGDSGDVGLYGVLAARFLDTTEAEQKAEQLQEKLNLIRKRYSFVLAIADDSFNPRHSHFVELVRLVEKDMGESIDLTQAA